MNGDLMGRGSAGVAAAFGRQAYLDAWPHPVPRTVGELRAQWRNFRGTMLVPSYGTGTAVDGRRLFERGAAITSRGSIPADLPDATPVAISFGREGEWWTPGELGVIHNRV